MKGVKNLVVIGVVLCFAVILCQNARAMLFSNNEASSNVIPATEPVIAVSSDEQTTQSEIIPSDETLEAIPGFDVVNSEQLLRIFSVEVDPTFDSWPPVVYLPDEKGQYFNPKTGALVGEFAQVNNLGIVKPAPNAPIAYPMATLITEDSETKPMSKEQMLRKMKVGCLTAIGLFGAENKIKYPTYVVITGIRYRKSNLFTPGGWVVQYYDQKNNFHEKYLNLFISDLGWDQVFYQPRTQEE
jgi:hypothetical protein